MTPETALPTIPGFSNAVIGMTLADGPTNKTVLVDNFDSKYVLRVDKPFANELGLDRLAEEEICRMVASAGLAPEPVYYDHGNGISLRRFVSGTNWLESDLRKPRSLKKLAELLRRLHAMPAAGVDYDLRGAVGGYAEFLATDEADQLARQCLESLGKARELQDGKCLCHNDALNHNIIDAENKTLLIDWEFAGMGDPYFDLAVVVQHHNLGEKLGALLLTAYLVRKPASTELDRLWLNCEFYAVLLDLWMLRISKIKK